MNKDYWQPRIDYILDHFDFERVNRAMTALNWHWQDGVPDIPRLKQKARSLLWQAIEEDCGIATGGLSVRWCGDELELQFVLTDWDTIYYEE